VQVKPCVSCGGCTYKTYGRCVVRDDGDWIYPKVIGAEILIFVTPITFGSYSFKMKRVLDKFGLIMDRRYYLENKELVKGGMQGRQFKFFVLGIKKNCIDEEIEAFKKLHYENLIITRGKGKAYIVDTVLTSEMKNQIIGEVLMA
jgi:multimeric flavodoxin WrbA